MDSKTLQDCLGPGFEVRVRQAFASRSFDLGLAIQPQAFKLLINEVLGEKGIISAVLRLATQEDEVFDYPADWWQAFKERWFPAWLLIRFPVRKARVWAIHKFPELHIPDEFFGKEYVNFRVVDEDKLRRHLE